MPDEKNDIKTFGTLQNFINFDGSGTALSTFGVKVSNGITVEQSVGNDWDKYGNISNFRGITDFKTSNKIADLGRASLNFSSRSRVSYNNNSASLAERFALGLDIPVSDKLSFYFTPNSTTTYNFRTGKLSEPTLSVYSGANLKFQFMKNDCTLTAEGQAYDLIRKPTAPSKTGFNLMFKMNF